MAVFWARYGKGRLRQRGRQLRRMEDLCGAGEDMRGVIFARSNTVSVSVSKLVLTTVFDRHEYRLVVQ